MLFCYSSFRDIIKDVTVTLTPLTDFEKEIEKSSKKVSEMNSLRFEWSVIKIVPTKYGWDFCKKENNNCQDFYEA